MEIWIIWLIIAGILLVAEMLTMTFYLLWLAVGSAVAAIVSWIIPDHWIIPTIAGCITALILTFSTTTLTKRIHSSKGYHDPIDEIVGKEGIVVQEINYGKHGIVKVGQETWSASSKESLPSGEIITVIAKSTTILEVQKQGGNK